MTHAPPACAYLEVLTPRSAVLTEALAWVNAAVVAGMALGSLLGGVVVDVAGYRAGYLMVGGAAVVPLVFAAVGAVGPREGRRPVMS
ncbi:hypothetical protein ACEXQE_12950 [Herbiconiux sp. P17]|uniref:hypothetical protein n=1 Tax=Herbiconiux wuyangfengii TaxID=3342794 RepID=UPI0035B87A03